LERFTARAQRDNREVILLGTAPDPTAPNLRRLSAADAVRSASSWQPKPWPVDRGAALEALREETLEGAEIVWLSDGVAGSPEARAAAISFAQGLSDRDGPPCRRRRSAIAGDQGAWSRGRGAGAGGGDL
jgi:hypothetical protein